MSVLLLRSVICVPPCVVAKNEEEELKAQKDAAASKGQQQQQQQQQPPNQDTLAEPTSSSSTAAKAALSPSAVTGGIAFAARSHQGIADKAKEVRLLACDQASPPVCRFVYHIEERESCLFDQRVLAFCEQLECLCPHCVFTFVWCLA